MEVKAKARFIRMSPRKVRLVVDVIRGMSVNQALTQLGFMKKHAALPVKKLLDSAIANAENNFKLKRENLYIKMIVADGGPTLHRWTPKAHGRAGAIRKRTTHISILLDEKEVKVKKKSVAAKIVAEKDEKNAPAKKVKKTATSVKSK
jgi:large subunit ribosomal protein L22